MKRRDFLGATLGTLALSQVPFVAAAPVIEPVVRPAVMNWLEQLFLLPYDELKRTFMGTITAGWELPDTVVAAPALRAVENRVLRGNYVALDLVFEHIRAETTFIAGGTSLCLRTGKVLWRSSFDTRRVMAFGDTLDVRHVFECSGDDPVFRTALKKSGLY